VFWWHVWCGGGGFGGREGESNYHGDGVVVIVGIGKSQSGVAMLAQI